MPIFRKGMRPLSSLFTQLKALARTSRERWMVSRGYWPGAETDHFRLWWNEDDECIVEERSGDNERGH